MDFSLSAFSLGAGRARMLNTLHVLTGWLSMYINLQKVRHEESVSEKTQGYTQPQSFMFPSSLCLNPVMHRWPQKLLSCWVWNTGSVLLPDSWLTALAVSQKVIGQMEKGAENGGPGCLGPEATHCPTAVARHQAELPGHVTAKKPETYSSPRISFWK